MLLLLLLSTDDVDDVRALRLPGGVKGRCGGKGWFGGWCKWWVRLWWW
jgi:hypothetical protein